MIRMTVWCLFILLIISENHCSPNKERLLVHKVQDAETAETNSQSNTHDGIIDFRSDDESSEDLEDDPPGPEDHVIPYSEHENPPEVPTKPKYIAPGTWAKPDPKKNIPLDFVPTKSLAQVRGTHTVRVLPQSEAIAAASTDEERENAPRLREVVSKKKTNTVYSEEGYEDSAYDHAGHIRDADFHEGYARKLHDQHNNKAKSHDGGKNRLKKKKKKPKKKNSRVRSEEFDEFRDDYRDEHLPSEKHESEESLEKKKKQKYVNKIYKGMWKKPDINPKKVTRNEIEKLENDLERENEEAERGSENYESGTERDISQNYNDGDTNLEDSEYVSKTRNDVEKNTESLPFEKKENVYKENYELTTVQFETPKPGETGNSGASTSNYENPTTNNYYVSDGSTVQGNYEATTLDYNYPNNQQSYVTGLPTTTNYGKILWNYYQAKPNEASSPSSYLLEQTTIQQPLFRETTTLGPYNEQTSPLTLATINGHGPYLMVSENGEVTQAPNQLGLGSSPYYPNTILNQEYTLANTQGVNSRSGENIGPSTSGYGIWELNKGRYDAQGLPIISTENPATRFYDNVAFSSTPTYSVIALPPNAYKLSNSLSQDGISKKKNGFLNSAENTAGSQNSYNRENFGTVYNNWFGNKQNPSIRTRQQFFTETGPNLSKPKPHGKKVLPFFGNKPNPEYMKMLNFIKNQKNGSNRYSGQKSESASQEDFTIMKPPSQRESALFDFTLNSYPNVADYSSVTQESEAAQVANKKRIESKQNGKKYNGLSQKNIVNFKSPSIGNKPPIVINKKKLFPASELLPPPLYTKDNYADLNSAEQNNEYSKSSKTSNLRYNKYEGNAGVPNYNPDPKQLANYFESRKKTPRRQTRSLDETVINKERIAYGSTEYRDIGLERKPKSRAKRNLIPEETRSVTEESVPLAKEIYPNEKYSKIKINHKLRKKRRSHQDLLNSSHKVASDVINKEIDSRFKKKNNDDEDEDEDEDEEVDDEDEARNEKQVEIEDPDLDYLDEIQDVNDIENIPTTTKASIDFQKYPFYKSSKIPNSSPLKYIIDPKKVPKKTFGGMEFYDSRDKYIQCDEVDPNLEEVVPDDEEPVPNRGPKENLPRLRGLGDKLDCFKAKYFGINPFDNPLFFEKKINQPTPPTELNPMKLVARILELPEENRKYFIPAQSRKPERIAGKRIDKSNSHKKTQDFAETTIAKSISEPRKRRRHNADRNRIRESSLEKSRIESRRSRKRIPVEKQKTTTTKTTTELPDVDSVTPYQKEVYEDVMGTIKNLASFYEMFGAHNAAVITEATTISPNPSHILGAHSIKNVKTLNRVPMNMNGGREKDLHSFKANGNFHEEIEGMLPPPEISKKPKIMPYRTSKVSYNTRVRTESPPRSGDKKIIGYFRTVMVHKRSLDNHPKIDVRKHIVKKRQVIDLESEESQTNLRSVDLSSPFSSSSSASSTTETPKRGRRRKANFSTADTTTTTTIAPITNNAKTKSAVETLKPLYTIRSRSRNSKYENSNGLSTTTERPSATVDGKRNEPRYTDIIRRRNKITTTTTTTPRSKEPSESNSPTSTSIPEVNGTFVQPAETESREIYNSENSSPRKTKVSIKGVQPLSEKYEASASDFESEHIVEGDDSRGNYEEKDDETTDKPTKNVGKYEVRENVQENTTPSRVGIRKPTKISEYDNLESFISTDPLGYSKTLFEEVKPTIPYEEVKEKEPDSSKENYRNEESQEEEIEEDDNEYQEDPHSAPYREGESSDEDSTESPRSSESYEDSTNQEGQEKNNSEQEDSKDQTFFRYNTRPDSPFENFEDDKYSELGPRLNKPAFYHPTFEIPEYEKPKYFQNSNDKEKDETDGSFEYEKYTFPWSHDEEDEKAEAEEGYKDEPTGKYEYPWEKRERLAEERAKRRKDRERLKKLRDFSFLKDEDDDEDEKMDSSSKLKGEPVYSWDIYDTPSKSNKKNSWKTRDFDSDETSSEHRPVAKFSSKYNSGILKLPFTDSEPIKTADPKEIKKSVFKYLKEADEKSSDSTKENGSTIFTTSKPEHITDSLDSMEEVTSTVESTFSGSKNNKRISNSGIVPENITTAPRYKNRSKVTAIKDRPTLRPIMRSTTEAAVVAESQATEKSIAATTRKPWKKREGGYNSRRQSSNKAQESEVVKVVTSKPRMTVSTTEKLVKPSSLNRKRGKSNTVFNKETSPQSQDEIREKPVPLATTIHRRIRPMISTRVTSTKTNAENPATSKNPTQIDTKNSLKKFNYDGPRVPTISSSNSEDRNIETSTPASRTVEHHSRVSKEHMITKTSFPELNTMYETYSNKSMTQEIVPSNDNPENHQKSKKLTYSRPPDRDRNSFDEGISEDENPVKNESVEELSIETKETPEHVYEKKEILDKDGNRGMFISITPKNHTLGSSTAESIDEEEDPVVPKYAKFAVQTETPDAESNGDIRGVLSKDSSIMSHGLRKLPSRLNKFKGRQNRHKEVYENSEEDSDSEIDQTVDKSWMIKFEEDPSKRLYYYLEQKK